MKLCDDLSELKTIVRCVLVATIDALTIDELWKKVTHMLGGPHVIQLELFGYDTVLDFLKNIPDVVQLEDPENADSIVNLVSSESSRYMEQLVSTNIIRPPSVKNKIALNDLLVPYRTQCAFIRIFVELYPKGLLIEDFVSDILCAPIFKLYANYADVLLLNLSHIFKRDGLETISLQPTLLNIVNEIKEEDKFTAMDIYNINESSLEDENEDKRIANGLEYTLYNILEEPIRNNIELLLNEVESGSISERKICNLYIEKFGSMFSHYRRWGFKRVSHFFSKLPEICIITFLDNEVEIISVKNYCDIYRKSDFVKEINDSELCSISVKDTSENEPKENDGVLKKFLRNDPVLEASLNDCFLDQEIQHFELRTNMSFNVNVCRIMCLIPTIICQSLDKSQELKNLLIDMKKFYFMNECKFAFDPTITMVKQTYAFFLDDLWFRGIVLDISLSKIKMMNIDNGVINDVMFDDIRILHKQFSQLPAQSFTCHLHGIESIDEDKFSQIVNKTCTIHVVTTDQNNKYASVKIKLTNSKSNEYLNDEWLNSGVAEPCCSSSDEQ